MAKWLKQKLLQLNNHNNKLMTRVNAKGQTFSSRWVFRHAGTANSQPFATELLFNTDAEIATKPKKISGTKKKLKFSNRICGFQWPIVLYHEIKKKKTYNRHIFFFSIFSSSQ